MLYCGLQGVAEVSSRRATMPGSSSRRPTMSSTAAMQRTCRRGLDGVVAPRGLGMRNEQVSSTVCLA